MLSLNLEGPRWLSGKVTVSGLEDTTNKKQISYPNISSAIRPVPHGLGIPVPSPPNTVENIFFSDTGSECEIDDDVDEVYDSISDEHKLFTQSELNDLVRDLNLPKGSAEVLGPRLKEKKLLAPGTFRNREQEFILFFPQAGELVYCSYIPGLTAVSKPNINLTNEDFFSIHQKEVSKQFYYVTEMSMLLYLLGIQFI
ncbi:hypothetical protein AVEN_128987-1 [Araneus ventricosus]|uniref:Uncharacterized protein n=1 Tax=Araneus ventricosus TaxID=182803 RepID=A0A4Y2G957_ARAVE|nr:hypothetical protein AVEN_128987-1 [Araneus ventricosus]